MTAKILAFGTDTSQPRHVGKNQLEGVTGGLHSQLNGILNLSSKRGFHSERIPTEGSVRQFFAYLLSTKTLYIVQKEMGEIEGTDTLYVMKDPDDIESEKIEITVKEFYSFIADDPDKLVYYGAFLTEYTTKYGYIIGIVDDPDDEEGENMNYEKLSEVVHFHPESIPMIDPDDESGYSYAVIEKMGEVMIPAENFISTESYTPPLLFLLIDAVELIGRLAEDEDTIFIIRYASGDTPSLTMETNFRELLNIVDTSIIRGYPLLPAKYDTADKRRIFMYDRFVKKHLDPQFIGGRMMVDDE